MKKIVYWLILCWVAIANNSALAQPTATLVCRDLLNTFVVSGTQQTVLFNHHRDSLQRMDSTILLAVIGQLDETLPQIKNDRIKCRTHLLLGLNLHYSDRDSLKSAQAFTHLNKAMELAYAVADDQLISEVCRWVSQMHNDHAQLEQALWYGLKSIELAKKVGLQFFPGIALQHWAVGEWLYKTRNYRDAIVYLNFFINQDFRQSPELYYLFAYNTLGLVYQNLNQYDSSFFYYTANLKRANSLGRADWSLITRVNINNILLESGRFDTLITTAEELMKHGDSINDVDLVAISKYQRGTAHLKLNQLDLAEQDLKASATIMENSPYPEDAVNVYKNLGELYFIQQNFKGAYHYTGKYRDIEAANKKLADDNQYAYLQAKMALETNQERLLDLQRERKASRSRWMLLVGILAAFSIVGFLLLNRQKMLHKHHAELLYEKDLRHQIEIRQAREQLQNFTTKFIETNALIDRLHNELTSIQSSSEKELLQKTILTEEEWDTFKLLFDKTYPGFLAQVQQVAPDITKAELRMAALIHMQIENKDMASMQGISIDSVRKNKQRLRERLDIPVSQDIREYLVLFQSQKAS